MRLRRGEVVGVGDDDVVDADVRPADGTGNRLVRGQFRRRFGPVDLAGFGPPDFA